MTARHLTDVALLPRQQPCHDAGCSDPKCRGLTPDRRLTLAVIARAANRDRMVWRLGIVGVAEKRQTSQRAVAKQVEWLTSHGLIRSPERAKDGTIAFELTFARPARHSTFDVPGWWFDHLLGLELAAADLVTLLACATFARTEGLQFFPSIRKMAAAIGEDERHVRRRLSNLVAAGLLARDVQGHAGRHGDTPAHKRVNVWTLTALVGVERPVVSFIGRVKPTGTQCQGVSEPSAPRSEQGKRTQRPPYHSSFISERESDQQRPVPQTQASVAAVPDLIEEKVPNAGTIAAEVIAGLRAIRHNRAGDEWGALIDRCPNAVALVATVVATTAPNLKPSLIVAAATASELFLASKLHNPGGFLRKRLTEICTTAMTTSPELDRVTRTCDKTRSETYNEQVRDEALIRFNRRVNEATDAWNAGDQAGARKIWLGFLRGWFDRFAWFKGWEAGFDEHRARQLVDASVSRWLVAPPPETAYAQQLELCRAQSAARRARDLEVILGQIASYCESFGVEPPMEWLDRDTSRALAA